MYKSRKRSASPTSRRAPTSRRYDDDKRGAERSNRKYDDDSRSAERSRRSRPESDHYRPDSKRRHKREPENSRADKDYPKDKSQAPVPAGSIQVTFDDRSSKKVTLHCMPNDDIGSIKKMVAEAIGTKPNKFVIKRGAQTFKDQGSLDLYEVHDKTSVEILYT